MGPLSWGIAYTLDPSDTWAQVQGTKSSLTSFAPCYERSTSASSCRNVSMYWNSICTTSGAPEPDLIAVRSLVYSSSPCPAFTYLILMSGCASSNILHSCSPFPPPLFGITPRTPSTFHPFPDPVEEPCLSQYCHTNFVVSSIWHSAGGLFSAHCTALPPHLRPGIADPLGQGVAVGFDQFVDHICDLVQGEDARGVPVEHGGVMDMISLPLQRRPDSEILDSGVRGAGCGALRRKVPDVAGTQTGVVNQDRHFDTATFGEVRNEAGVPDVAVDGPRLAGDKRMHDERAVLDAAPQREVLSSEQFATGLGVLNKVLLTAPEVLVHRDIVEFDEPVIFEEVRYVLGVVLARLGDEVAEAAHQLEAYLVFSVHVRVLHCREQSRIGVLALHFEAGHPGDVVDAGALVEKLLMLDADV